MIEDIIEKKSISKLIPLWKLAGFITGYIPALLGKNFVYATIFYVESFVEKHYREQLQLLSDFKNQIKIKELISELMSDEVSHKEESLKKISQLRLIHRFWGAVVTIGSRLAVSLSKKI